MKINNCTKLHQVNGSEGQIESYTPRSAEEVTRLAKAWCELVLDQIETSHQLKTNSQLTRAFSKITGENSN